MRALLLNSLKRAKKVRYAVVGLGHIAQVAVLPAFRQSRNSELVALVSGDQKKLKALSRRYRVGLTFDYSEYDDCLKSGAIDAVYIALPNAMHEEYAVRAARAGIHVLCEKPLAVTSRGCERIIRATRAGRVRLMVAYRLHFDPVNLRAAMIANSGRLGEPRYFTSEFGYELKEQNIRARPEEGGSPLHDLGIYCVEAARYLFRSEPTEVFAVSSCPNREPSRIIQTVTATLRFPRERIATFTCSFGSAAISNYRIVGTRGDLFVENAYEYVGDRIFQLTVDEKRRTKKVPAGDQFAAELDYFSCCLLKGEEIEPSGIKGWVDVRIIEALLKSIETGRPVSLQGVLPRIGHRPSLALEIRKPAHPAPRLVRVERASK
jgi:glucose-fructose oxidoreductase